MLGFCLVVASAVMLFWTYAPAAFRTRRPWKGITLRLLTRCYAAGLIFGAFAARRRRAAHSSRTGSLLDCALCAPRHAGTTGWWPTDGMTPKPSRTSVCSIPSCSRSANISRSTASCRCWYSPFCRCRFSCRVPVVLAQSADGNHRRRGRCHHRLGYFPGRQGRYAVYFAGVALCIPLAAAAAEHVMAPSFRPRVRRTWLWRSASQPFISPPAFRSAVSSADTVGVALAFRLAASVRRRNTRGARRWTPSTAGASRRTRAVDLDLQVLFAPGPDSMRV